MRSLVKNWRKVAVIVIICTALDFTLHGIFGAIQGVDTAFVGMPYTSIFAKYGMVMPALIIYELIVFGVMSIIFLLIQEHLPSKGWKKGILYGISFGGLYFTGVFETRLLFNDTFFNIILTGIGDGVPISLMGFLIGKFLGTDSENKQNRNYYVIFVVAVFYIIGRYVGYSMQIIHSAYIDRPIGTLIWTLCHGLWIGIIYFNLQSAVKGKHTISQAVFFSVIVFGLNWAGNHFFISVMYTIDMIDTLVRIWVDIISLAIGVYTCIKLVSYTKSGGLING